MRQVRVHPLYLGLSWAYLVELPGGMILVDAGTPGSEGKVLDKMRNIGRSDLALIFLTHAHFDHYGAAGAVREATGAPVAIHAQDAPILARGETPLGQVRGRGMLVRWLLPLAERAYRPEPLEADLVFQAGQQWPELGLPVAALETPGHTPGSSTLLVDGRLAFAGDLLSSSGRPHVQRYFAHDWPSVADSLARVQNLGPAETYPGHGGRPITRQELGSIQPPDG